MRTILAMSVALAVLAPLASPCGAGVPGYAICGYVIGNGATPSAGIAGSGRVLFGTAGQPVVGTSDDANHSLCHGFWCFGGSRVVSVEPPAPGATLPKQLAFGSPRPNPARDAIRFAVDLPEPARVDLRVLDFQGRMVRVVAKAAFDAGFLAFAWDGAGEGGRRGRPLLRAADRGRPSRRHAENRAHSLAPHVSRRPAPARVARARGP